MTSYLLENLIRNAIQHGGTDVIVTVGAIEDVFSIADDGQRLPTGDHESLLEYGVSATRQGTGLGLIIVQEVADRYEWSVALTDSADGGARIHVTGVDPIQ